MKTVTLRLVPLEYDLEKLKTVLSKESWGTPVSLRRGLHKPVGNRRRLENEFVHVSYAVHDLQEHLILPSVDLEGHYIYITKPNASLKIQCEYCQGFWLSEERCWKKKRDLMQMYKQISVKLFLLGKKAFSTTPQVQKLV